MNIFLAILQVIIIFGVPALLIKFRGKKAVKLLGTIGSAYFVGIVLALIIFLIRKQGFDVGFNADISEIGSHAAIGIAIPLLLFSTNLKTVKMLSKRSLGTFGLLTLSAVIVSTIVGLCMRKSVHDSGKLAGMAVGLYTGGTPNLNAIGAILGVESDIIAMANLSDMLIGGVFYLFLLIACKPLLRKILKAPPLKYYNSEENTVENTDTLQSSAIDKKALLISFLSALAIAIFGAIIGLIIWLLAGKQSGQMTTYLVPAIMVSATILGLLGSCSKRLRETRGNNLLGHYLILVFSVALAMYMDFEKLGTASLFIFLLFGSITIGCFLVHVILCKVFKIDVDLCIVTLTAGIYGPAFIPAITKQIGNENLTSVGLICGSLGYAFGTFLGGAVGALLILA